MASLQTRHQRTCALGRPWTPSATLDGCDCSPTYYVASRVDGKLVREKVGTDRDQAEGKLAEVGVDLKRGDYRPPQHKRVSVAADEWLASLRRRSTTVAEYQTTLDYAKRSFGRKFTDKVSASDVRKMLELIEADFRKRHEPRPGQPRRELSPTTLAKHLRHASTFFEWCVAENLMRENPAKRLPKGSRPKPRKRRPAYFTDAELARLWPELAKRPVYVALCKLAVTTGMRHGELAGLRWSDVDFLSGELHLRSQFTHGELVDRTKDDEPRVVDLVPAARNVLESWFADTGDEGLVFENEAGGYLDDSRTRKTLYSAMENAGIPRVGERGGTRDFHSFRHTFARVALENGAPLEWVQAQLGHSSITLTRDTYGHWSRKAEKIVAEKLEGAFAV